MDGIGPSASDILTEIRNVPSGEFNQVNYLQVCSFKLNFEPKMQFLAHLHVNGY